MTRLATVLIPFAASIFHGDPTHRGCESCREAVSQGLAAIPEDQREAMEAGALWVEVMARKRQSTDTLAIREVVRYGGGPPDYHHEWHAQMSMGDKAENGYGDTVAAALTALLAKLGDPS